MTEFTRGERIILWLAGCFPRWLMEQPERILLNAACLIIGVSTMLPPPPENVLADFPTLGRMALGIILIAGSGVSLYGTARVNRAADRFGALALGSASLFLATLLFGTVGLRAMLTGIIFFAIFLAKSIRFIRSTAVRIRIRHHLEEMKAIQEEEAAE